MTPKQFSILTGYFIFFITMVGFVLPYLISAKNNEMVILGFFLGIITLFVFFDSFTRIPKYFKPKNNYSQKKIIQNNNYIN